jgi:hypothetical protein
MEATTHPGANDGERRPTAVTAIGSVELICGLFGLALAWLASNRGGATGPAAAIALVSLVRLWIGGALFARRDSARTLLLWLAGTTLVAQFFVVGCWIVRGAPWGALLPPAAGVSLIAFHVLYPWLVLWNLSGPPAFEWFRSRRDA